MIQGATTILTSRKRWWLTFLALSILFVVCSATDDGMYLIGTGIHDMTGPAAQINLMGYAKPSQTAHGIHQRLWARAFIIAAIPPPSSNSEQDEQPQMQQLERTMQQQKWYLRWFHSDKVKSNNNNGNKDNNYAIQADPSQTICFVSIDAGMGSDLLNIRVLQKLEQLLPLQQPPTKGQQQQQQQRLCHVDNLSISGTHTHSAPAGFLQYTLYQITSLGFSEETMNAYVEGIANAILRAYNNLQPGSMQIAQDLLYDANINRSPTSYLLNPQQERDQYIAEGGDTDKRMLQLSFTSNNNNNNTGAKLLGILNWFAVHGTSMNNSNVLISGDNKGYASYLMEKEMNGNNNNNNKQQQLFPDKDSFVAAFASTNLGDVSPNTAGPQCIDTGLPCDVMTSTCNGRAEFCIASGPGNDMYESTEIIGRKQFEMAMRLLQNATTHTNVKGKIGFRHSFINMSNLTVTLDNGTVVQTCPAALGYSFAGGTTDGPGHFTFSQGLNTSNPFWNMLGGFLSIPTEEEIACQAPKPILLNTGKANKPYRWDPDLVPISIFQLGQLFILNVPGECTTMAGRRLRAAIHNDLVAAGVPDPVVTIAGLANSYTHYVTTIEEYAGQRYEAASTLFGPHTLQAYIQEFRRITADLLNDRPSETASSPPDLSQKQISLIAPAIVDSIGIGQPFGSIIKDSHEAYLTGDTVVVSFRSANPRNDLKLGGTFLSVDVMDEYGGWNTVHVDNDWCTKFIWKNSYLGFSFAEIHWHIPLDTDQGLYRICHYGTRKSLLSELETALYYAPSWLTSNVVGSYAVSLVLQSVVFTLEVSDRVRRMLHFGRARYVDFQGCSRAFLVHVARPEEDKPI